MPNALTESAQPLTNSHSQSESNWVEQLSTESLQNQQDNDLSISEVKGFLLEYTELPKVNNPNTTVNCLLRQWDRLTIVNKILYRKWEKYNKEVVLQLVAQKSLRREIMCLLHNNRTSAHLGRERTMQSIKSRFFWPGMSDDIEQDNKNTEPRYIYKSIT